jgi:hypothetical protein
LKIPLAENCIAILRCFAKTKREKKKEKKTSSFLSTMNFCGCQGLQLSTNFVVILMPRVPGCAQKNTAPDIPRPQTKKEFR